MSNDYTTTIRRNGGTIVVLITYRNSSATAFAEVTIQHANGSEHYAKAKSQGPSAGGYDKMAQALSRLTGELQMRGSLSTYGEQRPHTWADDVAERVEGWAVREVQMPWQMRAKGGAL